MKQKTLIVLLTFVALLAVFIWIFERRPTPSQDEKNLFSLARADITKIELKRWQGIVVLEKSSVTWTLTEPFHAKASASEVDHVLSEIEFAKIQEVLKEKHKG